MGVSLLESALYGKDELKTSIAKIIVENSPILDRINLKSIQGNSYTYRRENTMPTVGFRAVNGVYTQNVGTIAPYTEVLSILGGEVIVDRFEVQTQGNVVDIKAKQYELKARAFSQQYDVSFFNGDTNTDPRAFDGLRKRLTGAQVIAASGGTTSATLTLAMLDQLLDSVPFDNKVLYTNRTLRRKITNLIRSTSGSGFIDYTLDEFGKQTTKYAGVDIMIMEHLNDASTVLDFTEDPGNGTSNTASIYCVSFGNEENVFGITNGSLDVKDFGEVSQGPYHLGRIEAYMGLVVSHPRAAARLYQLSNT